MDESRMSADDGAMGRGIVLHLLAGQEVVLTHYLLGDHSDLMSATEVGQGGVGNSNPLRFQLFLDSHQIPFTELV